jgi:hypothetical protein
MAYRHPEVMFTPNSKILIFETVIFASGNYSIKVLFLTLTQKASDKYD